MAFFNRFVDDYPKARVIHLTRNYRSTETILEASWQVIRRGEARQSGLGVMGSRLYSHLKGTPHVDVVELPSEKAEAVAVGQIIEKAVGGAGFLAIDSGKVDGYGRDDYSFADFAVLYRNIVPPEFHFSHHQRSGDNAYVQWVMTFSHPRLNGGEQITVPGVSYLRFSGAEKVAFHQDYFDVGAMLYEQIPVLGRIITHLKRRLGS